MERSEAYRVWYKKWYAENREAIIERAKQQRLADPEKQKEYNREYYKRNVDKIREYNRERKKKYYAEHKKELNAKLTECRRKKREEQKSKEPPAGPKPDKRKLPREFEPKETTPEPFGMPFAHHQRKRLLEICHQGFLQEQPKENPFFVQF